MAAVRPQFRVDVYVPAPNDPVAVSDQCVVTDCDRTAEALQQRLCTAQPVDDERCVLIDITGDVQHDGRARP